MSEIFEILIAILSCLLMSALVFPPFMLEAVVWPHFSLARLHIYRTILEPIVTVIKFVYSEKATKLLQRLKF